MKKRYIVFLIASGSLYAKEMPTPFWYSISQKILLETQRFIIMKSPDVQTNKRKEYLRTSKGELNCETTKQYNILPLPVVKLSKNGFWEVPVN